VPASFEPSKQWPLVVFLHGSGERGGTPELLKQEYLPKMLEVKTDMPFLVVSPVLPSGQWEDYLGPVDDLVMQLVETLPVDPDRLYLTGLSLGGFGTWAYALQYPQRFTAIAPISGGYIHGSKDVPVGVCKLKDVAVWVFHGDSDDGVKPFQAQVMVDALKPCGGEVKFDLYPNTGHSGAWFNAYEQSDLWDWLLAHSRK
jgi:predicted peptidase